jgi:hypothetical protein
MNNMPADVLKWDLGVVFLAFFVAFGERKGHNFIGISGT